MWTCEIVEVGTDYITIVTKPREHPTVEIMKMTYPLSNVILEGI